MIRILHLIESQADFQSQRGALNLSQGLGDGFSTELRTIGRNGDWRDLAAAVAALRGRRGEGIDIVHAWGPIALSAAALSGWGRILHSPDPEPTRRSFSWQRAVMGQRDVQIIYPTSTMRRMAVERGLSLERCHLIRPGVDFSRIRRRRNADLRSRLGFSDKSYVMLAAGESTRHAAHSDAAWAVGILNVMDENDRLLIWGRGSQTRAVAQFGERLGQPGLLTVAEQQLGESIEFEELLGAADAILVTAHGAVATLPIAICMAAGLPIISTVTYTAAELLEDHHTALMAPAHKPRFLARRVLDLREDSGLQWTICDMAKTEAYEYFSLTRFLSQFSAVYRQVAGGEKVQVPEQAPGAGLRFHGIA